MTNSYIIQSKKGNGDSGDEALTHAQMDINLGFLVPTGFILPYAGKLTTGTEFNYLNSTQNSETSIHRLPGDTTTQLAWLLCDGSAYLTGNNNTSGGYPELFERIGHVYTETGRFPTGGTTTTHFCVPDLRGQFIRGWDNGSGTDPNAGDRIQSGNVTGSNGKVSGDKPGSKQASDNKAHTHSVENTIEYSGSQTNKSGTSHARSIKATITSASTGGTESRPTNIALAYFIKT